MCLPLCYGKLQQRDSENPCESWNQAKASDKSAWVHSCHLYYMICVSILAKYFQAIFNLIVFKSYLSYPCQYRRIFYYLSLLSRNLICITHFTNIFRRPQHNSPLCWLTWHSHISSGQFLVNAGWDLRNESWLGLPGKTKAAEAFINSLREQVGNKICSIPYCTLSYIRFIHTQAKTNTNTKFFFDVYHCLV